jgi:hypothetical protein
MTMMMNKTKIQELGGFANGVKNSIRSMMRQIQTTYAANGLTLSDEQAYNKIGSTIDLASDT